MTQRAQREWMMGGLAPTGGHLYISGPAWVCWGLLWVFPIEVEPLEPRRFYFLPGLPK